MEIIDCSMSDCVLYQVQNGVTENDILHQFADCKIIRNNPSIDLYEGEIIKVIRQTRKTHIVKPMETLDIIAKQHNITTQRLLELNNLNSKRLFVGQSIIIDS